MQLQFIWDYLLINFHEKLNKMSGVFDHNLKVILNGFI